MSEVDARFVKRGLWTDVDQGSVLGKTITTDSTTGAIVIALMAVLSTMGTSHIWNVFLFVYHQIRANGHPADGLSRQQQVLLRSLLPPSSLMAESTKLWWSWRRRNDRFLKRSLIQFSFAAFCTVGFIAAGIASSFVVSNSDLVVLVHSPLCGALDPSLPIDVFRSYTTAVRTTSEPYAGDCYQNQTILPATCKAYVHPRISFTTQRAGCPFDIEFCTMNTSAANSAIILDSGPVDLNDGFGFNLPKKTPVSYQRRTSCAVLPLEGHTTIVNASDFPNELQLSGQHLPGEKLLIANYGERSELGEWKNVTTFVLHPANDPRTAEYSVSADRGGSGNSFVPLQGLRRNNADTVLIFMKNPVRYNYPVDDPFFSAHRRITSYDVGTGANTTYYAADNPIAGIGCRVQHQYCITTGSGEQCSRLDGLPQSKDVSEWEGATPLQISALQLVNLVNQYNPLSLVDTVRVQNSVSGGIVGVPIPPDQWISEVQRWEAFVWASLQVGLADYAIGPSIREPATVDHIIKSTSVGDRALCEAIKMRKAGGFVNINAFGMYFIIVTALFFAIVDLVLLRFLVYLSRFRKALSPRIERWIQDGVLQLQRRAYEAHKEGTWSDLSKEVPLTKARELLVELPLVSLPSASTSAALTSRNASQSSVLAQPQLSQGPVVQPQPTPRQSITP